MDNRLEYYLVYVTTQKLKANEKKVDISHYNGYLHSHLSVLGQF